MRPTLSRPSPEELEEVRPRRVIRMTTNVWRDWGSDSPTQSIHFSSLIPFDSSCMVMTGQQHLTCVGKCMKMIETLKMFDYCCDFVVCVMVAVSVWDPHAVPGLEGSQGGAD